MSGPDHTGRAGSVGSPLQTGASPPAHRTAGSRGRDALRFIRHLPDRLLHGLRRRRAVRRAGRNGSRVLVMCHGNICRSPYAAAVLRRELARDGSPAPVVDSAGFIGPGRRSPSNARAIAREQGVDIDGHVSKVVTPALIATSDLIIVMDGRQRRAIEDRFTPAPGSVLLLGDFDPQPIRRRAVLDPINRSEDVFRSVYARVERCVSVLAKALDGAVSTDAAATDDAAADAEAEA